MTTNFVIRFASVMFLATKADAYFSSLLGSRNSDSNQYCYLNVTAIHYELHIDPTFLPEALKQGTLLETATVSASVKANVTVESHSCHGIANKTVNVITMNPRFIKQIELDNVRVTHLGTGRQLQITNQSFHNINGHICEASHHQIKITGETLMAGDQLEVYVPYKMELNRYFPENNWKGLFFINAQEIHSTNFYHPLRTPLIFPSFDQDPSHKTSFSISVTRPSAGNFITISNMDVEQITNMSERSDWLTDNFRESVPLNPSQVSVVILYGFRSHSVTYSRNVTDAAMAETNINIWVNENRCGNENDLNITAEYALKLFGFFENKFGGWRYPLTKLDFISVPAKAAAIWGQHTLGVVINYASSLLLHEITHTPPKAYETLAQEILFQWLGGMVTIPGDSNPLCGDPTLSERLLGLSQYVATWAAYDIPEFARDLSPYPINRIRPEVGLLKGFELAFGRDVMETALVEFYLPKMKWKTGYAVDFYESLQQAIEKHNATHLLPPVANESNETNFLQIFDNIANHSYYNPYIHVTTVENETSSISVFQENVIGNYYGEQNYIATWWVPIKIRIGNNVAEEQIIWLPPPNSTYSNASNSIINFSSLLVTEKFVIANPDGLPSYVVKYDHIMLKKIIRQLNTNHLEILEKIRRYLMDNQFILLRYAEELDWSLVKWEDLRNALEMTKYLRNETSWMVWNTALYHVGQMQPYFEKNGVKEFLAAYFSSLLTSVLEKIGIYPDNTEDKNTTLLRSTLMEHCAKYKTPICTQFALERVKHWMNVTDDEPFPSGNFSYAVSQTLLCASVWKSWADETELEHERLFNFLLGKIFKLRNATAGSCGATQATQLLYALPCSKNVKLLESLLNHTTVGVNIPDYLREDYVKYLPHRIRIQIPLRLDHKVADFFMEEATQRRISPAMLVDNLRNFGWKPYIVEGLQEKITAFFDANQQMLQGDALQTRIDTFRREIENQKIVKEDFQMTPHTPDEAMQNWFVENTFQYLELAVTQ